MLAAVAADLVIHTLAVVAFGLSGYLPLTVGPTVMFALVGMLGAEVVFAFMVGLARDPVWLFGRAVVVVLLLSLIPALSLLFAGSMPGKTVAGGGTLMTERVATWAVSVRMLPSLTLAEGR